VDTSLVRSRGPFEPGDATPKPRLARRAGAPTERRRDAAVERRAYPPASSRFRRILDERSGSRTTRFLDHRFVS